MNQNKSLYKELFSIVTPIAFQNLMASLVTASDAFMLGFLDQDSLSAPSLAGQVAFVFSLFYGAFVFGLNVLAAQYWGKGDQKTSEEVLAITMRYSLLVGLIFTIGTAIFPEQIMHFFTLDANLITAGGEYLRTVSLSYLLTGFTQAYFGMMKVCDKAKLSSLIGSLSVVVNIVLNALLIFGLASFPKMGIRGAALATVLARAFETVFVLVVVANKKCPSLHIGLMFHSDNRELHKDYWRYTVPLLINQLGWGGGVTMYSVIMGHLGSDATAANSIASIVRSMIASFCWGISAGVGIIIGNSLNSTIISGIFPAGGDTKFGMWCDLITLWCVVVPLGMIGAFILKLPVLAVAFILTLDEFVKIPAVYRHYIKYKWVRNITKENKA